MSVRRRRSQLKGIDEINMTPLIDLTFLLLIVFMITMPLMEYSTDVSAPAMNSAEITEQDNVKYINLKPDGVYVIDKQEMNESQARDTLNRFYFENPEYKVFVRADEECSWGDTVSVVRMARDAGFAKASFVTTAE